MKIKSYKQFHESLETSNSDGKKIPIENQDEWKKHLPKELHIITDNGEFRLTPDQNIVVDHGTLMILYKQNTPELNNGDVLADGEPDSMQFDIRFVKNNDSFLVNRKNITTLDFPYTIRSMKIYKRE